MPFIRAHGTVLPPPPPPPPPPPTEWIVGNHAYSQGSTGNYNVAATGPVALGYTAGGVYGVSPAGTPLPTGVTMTTAGAESYDGFGATIDASGIVYTYHEPGAIPTLTLYNTSVVGALPWMGTAYPAEGAVPSGLVLSSVEDPTVDSTVLSTWPDGSAQVIVLAGSWTFSSQNTTKVLRLIPADSPAGPLTLTNLSALFIANAIQVNFGAGVGTLTSTQLETAYDRIWWANSQVICARYRLAIPGKGAMEAVIDIHAFAGGRAFVEVVIENARVNPVSPFVGAPADESYTGATVTVNGTAITQVGGVSRTWTSPDYANWPSYGDHTRHNPFRAWYCSGWVGGDPETFATHDTLSMQSHPLFMKMDKATTLDFNTYIPLSGLGYPSEYWVKGDTTQLSQPYSQDSYTPWAFGRLNWDNMGSGGEHQSYGALPKWEQRYIQSGDRHVRNASIQTALATLTYAINYRSTATNLVPSHTETYGKSTQAASWPDTGNQFGQGTGWGTFEVAHEPAVGLVAFMCRPSPCFIEIAQKIACLNAVADSSGTQQFNRFYQTRGKAFCLRNLMHAALLTPTTTADSNLAAWRTAALNNASFNVSYMLEWDDSAEDKLNILWESTPTRFADHSGEVPDGIPFQFATWLHQWLAMESYKLVGAKLLSGAAQTDLERLADWALLQPIRWVNEQPGGGWRYIGYRTTCGTADGENTVTMGQLADWGTMRAVRNPNTPSSVSGEWRTNGGNDLPDFHHGTDYLLDWIVFNGPNQNLMYVPIFWGALVAAVERGVAGADTAWNTVIANVTNLSAFRDWFATNGMMYGWWPRNKP